MPECFVVMSFDPRLKPVFDGAILPAVRNAGYSCTRADSIAGNDDVPDTANRKKSNVVAVTHGSGRRGPETFRRSRENSEDLPENS